MYDHQKRGSRHVVRMCGYHIHGKLFVNMIRPLLTL